MATPRPPKVVLSEQERAELERLVRAFTTGQQLALRARIVLLAGDGLNNMQIARELGVDDETPGHWRGRWLQFRDVSLDDLSVAGRLADAREGPRQNSRLSRSARLSPWLSRCSPTPTGRSVRGATVNW